LGFTIKKQQYEEQPITAEKFKSAFAKKTEGENKQTLH